MTNPYASPEADLTKVSSGNEGVSEATMDALRNTKKWVRLVGVMLLVIAVITALGGVAMMFGLAMGSRASERASEAAGFMFGAGAMYICIAAVYGVLGLYLTKYASAITRLLEDGQVSSLENALQQQQKFWRLAGGLIAVLVSIMVIGIGAAIFIPLMQR